MRYFFLFHSDNFLMFVNDCNCAHFRTSVLFRFVSFVKEHRVQLVLLI